MRWQQMSPSIFNYLEIGNAEEMPMKDNLYTDRYQVWDELFPMKIGQ